MHWYRANKYVLSKRLNQSELTKSGRERVPDRGASDWKRPTAVSAEPEPRYRK